MYAKGAITIIPICPNVFFHKKFFFIGETHYCVSPVKRQKTRGKRMTHNRPNIVCSQPKARFTSCLWPPGNGC